jgi:CubicO group peptidase (beta-lactamase class C family)
MGIFLQLWTTLSVLWLADARRSSTPKERGPRKAPRPPHHHNATTWGPLQKALDGWLLTENFGLVVGNASGKPLLEYTHGNFSLHTVVETASTSKWPIAMMFAGMVDDGTISSLDALASDFVPWWSKDTSCQNASACDAKGNITVRQLLSFTSGFDDGDTAGGGGSDDDGSTCLDDEHYVLGYDACARETYDLYNLSGAPGATWTYNSLHLQLMGAVAHHASGLGIQAIVDKYLRKAYGLNETWCGGPSNPRNPEMAVCLLTTGADYQKFLAAQLTASVLSPAMVAESEKSHNDFDKGGYQLYGLYGFGHFLECFDSADGFTDACGAAQVHADPGAYGYYPLIDRRHGYYLQLVAYETAEFYPRSGIPEYLRQLVKPLVDAVMRGDAPNSNEQRFEHHTAEFNGLSMVDVNYITDCFVNPKHCE